MKTYLEFDGFDEILKDIEKKSKSIKIVTENALKKARDQINNEIKVEMSKHHITGKTESSIKDEPVEWDGLIAKIPIGFDINNGGYPSIFLIYGTPKQKPDSKLRKILGKVYRNKVLSEKIKEEYNKIIKM